MDYLMTVDSVSPVPAGYKPRLSETSGVFLEEVTAEACRKMLNSAEKSGVMIKLLSGYRSAEYQKILWDKSVMQFISEGLSCDEAEILTGRTLAEPQHSEHQLGLACDFCSPDSSDVQNDFFSSAQGKWLAENAAGFGFILRYPRMKEHITGISYEPWHYRYTGLPHSVIMRSEGLVLEEYLYYYGLKKQYLCSDVVQL